MARKRKRSSSRTSEASDDGESTSRDSASPKGGSPFQGLIQDEPNETSADDIQTEKEIFSTVLTFLELTTKKTLGVDGSQADDSSKTDTSESTADRLLNILITGMSKDKIRYGLIAIGDIANLLLPWAIKRLLRASASPSNQTTNTMELEWKILYHCTELSLKGKTSGISTDNHDLSSHLSLSALHKLVPLAGTVALGVNDDDSTMDGCSEMAATCYCSWVQNQYRPQFDTVCESLLPLIGKQARIRLGREGDRGTPMDERHDKMVVATLVLLQESLKKANPKKTFQSLIRYNTLSALSDIYSVMPGSAQGLVRALINEGLYHLEHHLDGFRSLQLVLPDLCGDDKCSTNATIQAKDHEMKAEEPTSETKSFHCYQEGLLSNIREVFSVQTETKQTHQLQSLARITPLLLDCFIQQTNASQNQKNKAKEKVGKKQAIAKKILQLQFLFFANLVTPMVQYLQNGECNVHKAMAATSYKSLEECVRLLLKNDVNLPSNDDAGEKYFVFFQNLSQLLIQNISSSKYESAESHAELPVLGAIFQLNHLIFHGRLMETISSCLTFRRNEGGREASVPRGHVAFFCIVLTTYRRLRQLDYLCAALVQTALHLCDRNDFSGLEALWDLFQEGSVCVTFGEAVWSSPIQQTKQMVFRFNEWIKASAAKRTNSPEVLNAAFSLVVGVFCLLLQNVRVDAASAVELNPLCQVIEASSVDILMDGANSLKAVHHLAKEGMRLCGWTVDLKNRCDFWLRNSREKEIDDDFQIPDSVSLILAEAVEAVSIDFSAPLGECLEELQFLACHRLQQLHASTYEKQRVAFATDAEEFGFASDLQVTTEIATFALRALRGDGSSEPRFFKRRWDTLAGAIASWAPFVEAGDMTWFLSYFFARVSDRKVGEGDGAQWLLRDANFLDAENVHKHFGPAGLLFVARTVQQAVGDVSMEDGTRLRDLAQAPGTLEWSSLGRSRICGILQRRLKSSSEDMVSQSSEKVFSVILHCLNLVNSLQGSMWDSHEYELDDFVEFCLRLDYVVRYMEKQGSCSQNVAFRVVASLRMLLSRLMLESKRDVNARLSATTLLAFLFQSTVDMIDKIEVSDPLRTQLLKSAKGVIAHLLCEQQTKEELSDFSLAVQKLYRIELSLLSESQSLVLTSFGQAIISVLARKDSRTGIDGSKDIIEDICTSVWNSAVSVVFNERVNDAQRKHASAEFIAVLLTNGRGLDGTKERLQSIEAPMVDKALEVSRNEFHEKNLEDFFNLVACFATANPTKDLRRTLFDALTATSAALPELVQNIISELAMGMDNEELCDSLSKLTAMHAMRSGLSSRLRVFRLIILSATSPAQVEAIAKISRRILSLALGAMASSCADGDGVQQASDLIQEMASNKDIMSFRERELCLIFAHVVGTMRPTTEGRRTASDTIFNASFSIVSFMLQRFSKQLHNCIPSVVNCLSVILEQCLYGELDDLGIIDRGHKFGRLCELLLPHGEVYKKHVLCLVVEFVEALKRDMDPIRKNSLSSAIYSLLDILQQHETKQLNSMLDDMGRALLRTVHESYKKQHVYKGQ